jgi:hypothetical protein
MRASRKPMRQQKSTKTTKKLFYTHRDMKKNGRISSVSSI